MDIAAYNILGRRFKLRDGGQWDKASTGVSHLFCERDEVVTVESVSSASSLASNINNCIVRVSHDGGGHSLGSYTYFMKNFDLVVDDIVIESVDQKQISDTALVLHDAS
jgi:hypothetical protein